MQTAHFHQIRNIQTSASVQAVCSGWVTDSLPEHYASMHTKILSGKLMRTNIDLQLIA